VECFLTAEDTEDTEEGFQPLRTRRTPRKRGLRSFDSEALRHFFVEKAFARIVGLDPFSVDHELRDGPPARSLDNFFRGAGSFFDVNLGEWNVVLL
jgi:hypothetical protein